MGVIWTFVLIIISMALGGALVLLGVWAGGKHGG